MQIITKSFNSSEVRIIVINGKEYFIAKDIASILQYKKTANAIKDHCKKPIEWQNLNKVIDSMTIKLHPQTKVILEPDVWRLIIKSEMPEAEKIETWIFEEVLPSIRKTGKYELKNSQPTQPVQTSQDFDIKSYTQQNRDLIELIELINSKNAITLHYLNKLTKTLNLKSPLDLLGIDLNLHYFIPTELGKFLNKSAVEINKILEAKKYQIKINGIWQLTEAGQKYAIQLENNYKTIKWKLESLV
jgi:prophage antirepressor-like protein